MRTEGPWPGRKDAAFVAAGPGTLDANFSHFFLSLGLGMRFTNAARYSGVEYVPRMRAKFTSWVLALVAPVALASAQGSVTVRRVPYDQSGGWNLVLSVNRPVGGPTGQMKARLLEEGWTEHYCDVWKANCHDNPLIAAARSRADRKELGRRLRGRLDANMLFTYANLGSAEGRLYGTDMRADWSTMMAGASVYSALILWCASVPDRPLAFLNSSTTGDDPRTLVRAGRFV